MQTNKRGVKRQLFTDNYDDEDELLGNINDLDIPEEQLQDITSVFDEKEKQITDNEDKADDDDKTVIVDYKDDEGEEEEEEQVVITSTVPKEIFDRLSQYCVQLKQELINANLDLESSKKRLKSMEKALATLKKESIQLGIENRQYRKKEKQLNRSIITKPPKTTLKYELKKIPEASALKKFKNVLMESVDIQWVDANRKKRNEKLVTFVYKPEKQS